MHHIFYLGPMNGKMDSLVVKWVYDMEVNTASSSLLPWKAIVPPVEIQFKNKRSFRKSKNTLHKIERKKFAFCAFGLSQSQKNTPAV